MTDCHSRHEEMAMAKETIVGVAVVFACVVFLSQTQAGKNNLHTFIFAFMPLGSEKSREIALCLSLLSLCSPYGLSIIRWRTNDECS